MRLADAATLYAAKPKNTFKVSLTQKDKLINRTISQTASKVFKGKMSRTDGLDEVKDLLKESYIANAAKSIALTGEDVDEKVIEKAAQKYANKRGKLINKIFKDASAAKSSGAQDDQTLWRFSKTRADGIGDYESRAARFEGFDGGFKHSGKTKVGKMWVTGDSPCADCTDNEADDVIDMDEEFQSGDMMPPAHPNCTCTIQYVWDE